MKLTKSEQDICNKYSEASDFGKVLCNKCPLAIPEMWTCKGAMGKEDWNEFKYMSNKEREKSDTMYNDRN